MPSDTVHPASLDAWRALPAQRPADSSPPSWRSVLVRRYDEPTSTDTFATAPSDDLLLVIQRSGAYRLESRRGGRWRGADYRPGAMGLTAPGVSSMLRWRPLVGAGLTPDPADNAGAHKASTVQVHLAPGVVTSAARALGTTWRPEHQVDVLALHHPGVLATALALQAAVESSAPRLVGETLAEALAVQLLLTLPPGAAANARASATSGRRPVQPLSGAHVRRVVDHLQAHLAEDVGLAECAALVGASRSHFLRAFSAATGTTPHRYLVRLRLERAAQLLRTTELSVLDVAVRCGYAGTSHFAAAFTRQHGLAPSLYRRARR